MSFPSISVNTDESIDVSTSTRDIEPAPVLGLHFVIAANVFASLGTPLKCVSGGWCEVQRCDLFNDVLTADF
jgi:hypothetical protein